MMDAVLRRAPCWPQRPPRPNSTSNVSQDWRPGDLPFWARAPFFFAGRDLIVGGAFQPEPL
jgi:hypothetical protein